MERKIVRVKLGSRQFVFDFEEVCVVVQRYKGVIYYDLRGYRVSSGISDIIPPMLDSMSIMDDSSYERLLDIAEYLNDMLSEVRPDLPVIDCSPGSDIDSLVRDHMAKKSCSDQEEA